MKAFILLSMILFYTAFSASLVISDTEFPSIKYASSDFNPQTGLVYQGLSSTEHIYLNTEELLIQGKQKGSVNIIDFNNDGLGDLFTTGFYINKEGYEIASTELHQNLKTKTGNFPQLKYSDSCWADFDNNGFLEPALFGQDDEDKNHFIIYRNENSIISDDYLLPGLKHGSLECFDLNKDGWIDIVACGQDEMGNPFTAIYQNKEGILEKAQSLKGLAFCSIEINDFNSDGFPDLVVGGEDTNYQAYLYLYTYNGRNFNEPSVELVKSLKLPKAASADFDNDGFFDLAVAGSAGKSTAYLLHNQNGNLQIVSSEIRPLQDGTIQFLDYDKDNKLDLFITGVFSDGIDEQYESQLLPIYTAIENKPPSSPSHLSFATLENQYIKLSWQKAIDDHTEYLFYHVRAGLRNNPDQFLSGYLSSEKGNAQLTEFKILKNPCLTGIDSFSFQVRAIDGSFALSQWSEPYEILCSSFANNTESGSGQNKTNLPKETIEQQPKRWSNTQYFQKLKYYAEYERLENSILVTEIITNQDVFLHANITINHTVDELLDQGGYSIKRIGQIGYFQKQLEPSEKIYLSFGLRPLWPSGRSLLTQITSQPVILPGSIRRTINTSATIVDNKTIIEFKAKVNDSNLLEKDVVIIQALPKCLIEKINELAIHSGKIKSNRKFIILEEDPVIMWTFDAITTPEHLKLEIQAVADENCSNQIKTEIVAKEYLAQNLPINPIAVFLQISISLLLFIFLTIILKYARKTTHHKKTGYMILLTVSLLFIVLNILDIFLLLPAALDFLKKILAWLSILLLMLHLDLAILFTGLQKDSAKISRFFFNSCLITGFIFLSVKDIVFIALETYGRERIFSDLLMLIIRYSNELETYLFFSGAALVVMAIFIGWLRFPLLNDSIAETAAPVNTVIYSKHMIQKLLLIVFLVMGFYTAIFHFLFDWFSIGIDGPFLLLLIFFSYNAMAQPDIEELSIQRYLKMFTHRQDRWIALSFIPVLIFMVEAYLSVFYWLTGQKNLYLKSINIYLPTLVEALQNTAWLSYAIYLLQIFGLVCVMACALSFWWQHYRKSRNNQPVLNRPSLGLLSIPVILGLISFLLKPVFELISLENSRLSGVLLALKASLPNHNFYPHYAIISIMLLFLLFICKTKWPGILSHIIVFLSVSTITILFLLSYLTRIIHYFQRISTDNITAVGLSNSLFLMVLAAVYTVIIALSLYAWFRLVYSQLKEDFNAINHSEAKNISDKT